MNYTGCDGCYGTKGVWFRCHFQAPGIEWHFSGDVLAGIYGSAISMGLVTCYGKDDRLFYPAVNLAHSTRSARMGHLRRLSALLCTVKTSLRMVFMKLGQLCLMCWDMWQAVCTFHSCAVYSRIETLCFASFLVVCER